jgi:hypothetical protein
MLGDATAQDGVRVFNHVATDSSMLRRIGSTEETPEATKKRGICRRQTLEESPTIS